MGYTSNKEYLLNITGDGNLLVTIFQSLSYPHYFPLGHPLPWEDRPEIQSQQCVFQGPQSLPHGHTIPSVTVVDCLQNIR